MINHPVCRHCSPLGHPQNVPVISRPQLNYFTWTQHYSWVTAAPQKSAFIHPACPTHLHHAQHHPSNLPQRAWLMPSASFRVNQVGISQGCYWCSVWRDFWLSTISIGLSIAQKPTNPLESLQRPMSREEKVTSLACMCTLSAFGRKRYSLRQQVHKDFQKIPHASFLIVVQHKSPYVSLLPCAMGLRGRGQILWVNNCLHSWCWIQGFVFYNHRTIEEN